MDDEGTLLIDRLGTLKLCLWLCKPDKSLGELVSSPVLYIIMFLLPFCVFSLKELLSLLNLSNKAAEDEKTETALESVL
jgi:hypothetical protein